MYQGATRHPGAAGPMGCCVVRTQLLQHCLLNIKGSTSTVTTASPPETFTELHSITWCGLPSQALKCLVLSEAYY